MGIWASIVKLISQEEEERRPPARSDGQEGGGGGLGPSWCPGFPAEVSRTAGVCRRGVSAPKERVDADRQFQPRVRAAPSPPRPRRRQQQPWSDFPSPPPALSPPAPRPVSGSGSGRRRCRWGRTGDGPGAQEGCELEAAVQKSCQVSSAGSGGSWSRGQEDPRGRSPPGTNGHGCEGVDELGGRGHRWCGALGPVIGAFPCTGEPKLTWNPMTHSAAVREETGPKGTRMDTRKVC
nr:uncharacterized protein LOC103239535 [Chlorocebus sabaeus]